MTLNRIFGIKYLFSDKIFFPFYIPIAIDTQPDVRMKRNTVITVLVIFRKTPYLVSVFINLWK